jgi:hypothetical protein
MSQTTLPLRQFHGEKQTATPFVAHFWERMRLLQGAEIAICFINESKR